MALHVDASWVVAALGVVGTVGAGGWALLVKRAELRRSPPAEIKKALAEATQADAALVEAASVFVSAMSKTGQQREARMDAKIADLEAKVDACEARHDQCEVDLDTERQARRQLTARIDALMGGAVAAPGQQPLPGL